jgi:hypothetical protein
MSFQKSKSSHRKLIVCAVAALTLGLSLARPQVAAAGPTDTHYSWSVYAFVRSHGEGNTGDVVVTFQDANGAQVTHFPDPQGGNTCPGNPNLLISKDHPLFARLSKSLQAAGLARRLVWFGYERTGTTCYVKTVQMFF